MAPPRRASPVERMSAMGGKRSPPKNAGPLRRRLQASFERSPMTLCKSPDIRRGRRKGGSCRMSDVFVSYARSTEAEAKEIAQALRAEGYSVWRDDEIPPHKP